MFVDCELYAYIIHILVPVALNIIYLLRTLYCVRFRKRQYRQHYESLYRDDKLMANVDSNNSNMSFLIIMSESMIGRNSCSMFIYIHDKCRVSNLWIYNKPHVEPNWQFKLIRSWPETPHPKSWVLSVLTHAEYICKMWIETERSTARMS